MTQEKNKLFFDIINEDKPIPEPINETPPHKPQDETLFEDKPSIFKKVSTFMFYIILFACVYVLAYYIYTMILNYYTAKSDTSQWKDNKNECYDDLESNRTDQDQEEQEEEQEQEEQKQEEQKQKQKQEQEQEQEQERVYEMKEEEKKTETITLLEKDGIDSKLEKGWCTLTGQLLYNASEREDIINIYTTETETETEQRPKIEEVEDGTHSVKSIEQTKKRRGRPLKKH